MFFTLWLVFVSLFLFCVFFFFFSSRRRHTRLQGDWSSDVCSSDLVEATGAKMPKGTPVDGRSFLPQLRGERGNPKEWIYCHYDPRPGHGKEEIGRASCRERV